MRKLSWWAVPFVFTILVPTFALASLTRTGEASAIFVAVGPAGLKIEGKTSELDVAETDGKVKVSVALANIDTGIALRNKHMREKYLDVAQFPRAELVVDRGALKIPTDGADAAGGATGSMTIHGRTKPIVFQYAVRRSNGTYTVTGSTHINIRDFGVDVPSYLGVTVKPDVDISVRFAAADR